MNLVCTVAFWQALGTWAAVSAALILGWYPIYKGQKTEKARAAALRQQLYHYLQLIQPHLADRCTPVPPRGMDAIRSLEALWPQSHILEPEEFKWVSRSISALAPLHEGWGMGTEEAFPVYSVVLETLKVLAKRLDAGSTAQEPASSEDTP